MGRYIVKLADDKYVEWSTVVDAPVTCIFTREEMLRRLRLKYAKALEMLPTRPDECIAITDKFGTSCRDMSLKEALEGNRAGDAEVCLTLEEIIEQYKKPDLKE